MHQKMIKTIFILNIVQTVIYLFGFFNRVAEQSGLVPLRLCDTSMGGNFYGIIFGRS